MRACNALVQTQIIIHTACNHSNEQKASDMLLNQPPLTLIKHCSTALKVSSLTLLPVSINSITHPLR